VGSGASSFWSNVINNIGGQPAATSQATSGWQQVPGGVNLFGNGTFSAGGTYVDPGQLTYNAQTGQVQESPFSGMSASRQTKFQVAASNRRSISRL